MTIKMHNRLAVRTIGEPFETTVAVAKRRAILGEMTFAEPPKQKTVVMQKIEYITARTIIIVPVAELSEIQEP